MFKEVYEEIILDKANRTTVVSHEVLICTCVADRVALQLKKCQPGTLGRNYMFRSKMTKRLQELKDEPGCDKAIELFLQLMVCRMDRWSDYNQTVDRFCGHCCRAGLRDRYGRSMCCSCLVNLVASQAHKVIAAHVVCHTHEG